MWLFQLLSWRGPQLGDMGEHQSALLCSFSESAEFCVACRQCNNKKTGGHKWKRAHTDKNKEYKRIQVDLNYKLLNNLKQIF